MNDRERLIEILSVPIYPHELADPAEVVADYLLDHGVTIERHGWWEEKPFLLGTTNVCSECGEYYGMPHGKYNYCPNCGAKMDGGV